jgi:hypothetical protein
LTKGGKVWIEQPKDKEGARKGKGEVKGKGKGERGKELTDI